MIQGVPALYIHGILGTLNDYKLVKKKSAGSTLQVKKSGRPRITNYLLP